MILGLVDEAVAAGARRERACVQLGLTERCLQRWRVANVGDDHRAGPKTRPANALTAVERAKLLEVVNSPAYRDLPPKQVVPRLADEGRYIGSESTIYRVLHAAGQDAHRGRAKPRTVRAVDAHVATGPNPRSGLGRKIPFLSRSVTSFAGTRRSPAFVAWRRSHSFLDPTTVGPGVIASFAAVSTRSRMRSRIPRSQT